MKRIQALSSCPFPYCFIFFKNVLIGSSPQGIGSNAALVKTPYVPRWLKNRNTMRIYHEITPPNSQLVVPLETTEYHLPWNSVYFNQKSKQRSSFIIRALGNLTCTFHSLFHGTGNGAQGLKHTKQMLYHQATSPAPPTLLLLLVSVQKMIYPLWGCSLSLRRRNSYKVLNLDSGYLSKGFRTMIVLPLRAGF